MHGLFPAVQRSDRAITTKRYYKEHIPAILCNKDTSTYVQHLLNTEQFYGNIENTMKIIQITQRRSINSLGKILYSCNTVVT
jgi:hypothetical protein